ncbi:hypothetical protein HUT06_29555 [Actinomadura sp. NAK00032]|uniref:hypothetical protein n=1 Tax=Actinomadura sp. NAK00032 TaxID=2742128 RepID=UPI00159183E3|nr:hypothetical protein [Actinomadura sp. NAK00032]QKW37646.1 hypothetical protein HUT06_29555 [Actinomadura sp. NAK00032]
MYALLGQSQKRYAFGVGLPLGQCTAWLHQTDVTQVPGFLKVSAEPYLVVVPAFLLWLVTKRRAAGWVALAILAPVLLAHPLMFGYDVARWGQACTDLWLTPWPGRQIAWWTGRLVLVALLLAAVYRPGRRMVRAVSGVLVAGLVLGAAGDQRAPQPVMAGPQDCPRAPFPAPQGSETLVRMVKSMSERERYLAYLCSVRGRPPYPSWNSPAPKDPLSDGVLLDMGRRACLGEKPTPQTDLGRHGVHWPSVHEMAYLCPRRAATQLREQERKSAAMDARYDRERAQTRAYCKRAVPKGPKPVAQATDVMSGGESGSYFFGSAGDSFDAALKNGLVASDGRSVTVITGTQGPLCMTVRAYRKAPPLALKGWDQVAEVGFDSPDGRSTVGSMSGPSDFPAVTAAGPGPYRVRVYVRGRGEPEAFFPEMPAEEHLLVVFPGKSKKPKSYKNGER